MDQSLTDRFTELFGAAPDAAAFSPGRVNLIGEHTDYNGGCVLPCALSLGITCAIKARSDGRFFFYSESFPDQGAVEGRPEDAARLSGWHKYPCAVLKAFSDAGCTIGFGADLYFCGDLPYGAGLSSSAALEVSCAFAVNALYGLEKTKKELARIAWYAENKLIGVSCGIMDQFACALSEAGSALLLDTATQNAVCAPLNFTDCVFLAVNSGVKHSLSSGGYNDRRRECAEAYARLRVFEDKPDLCAISMETLSEHQDALGDTLYRRARHAISENGRVRAAADAMERGDAAKFGKLMRLSHISQRDDFCVSCAEVDFLAEFANAYPGVYGARLTGGGFGGCTVNLLRADREKEFCAAIRDAYDTRFGIKVEFYSVRPGAGARLLPGIG